MQNVRTFVRAVWLVVGLGLTSATLVRADGIVRFDDYPDSLASDFTTLGTKWGLGPNQAQSLTFFAGTPGSATWSIMAAGLGIHPDAASSDPDHASRISANLFDLIPGGPADQEAQIIQAALNVWAAAANFTNLGQVADGNVAGGAPDAQGGNRGDIRIGAFSYPAGSSVLAHAFQPGTEDFFNAGGTIGGDMHISTNFIWADDPTDTVADNDYDLFTVVLHELGHALGLGHTNVANSVMNPNYGGARRTLGADDIAGIQAIYGPPAAVPEPGSLALVGLGLATLGASRFRRKRAA